MNKNQSNASVPAGGILDPISLESFFADYWEQQPLHIERSKSNPFADLISIEVIEDLLSTHALSFPTIQLSQAGQAIPVSEYTDENERIVSNRISERYKRGSTIVISYAHRLVSNLMGLCRAVESSVMMRCQTNAYLSPAGFQGFNPHFDTHDVFILQVGGKKTFNFYSSGADFPTSANRFNREVHKVGEKTEEIALSAGDTLYIPRGFVHDAVADKDEPSLHITLGVYPVLLHNLIDEIVRGAVDSDPRMRRAVAQSTWMQANDVQSTTQLIRDVLAEQLDENVVSAALDRLRDEFAIEAIPDTRGSLVTGPVSELPPESAITVDRTKLFQLDRDQATLKLRAPGQVLEFAEPHAAAVEWLLEQDRAQLSAIPGLEHGQKQALIEQLVAAGVINV